jgi:hypothetical protein
MAELTYPLDDAEMIYNYKAHRYVLEKNYLLNMGQNLDELLDTTGDANKNTLPSRFLDRVSYLVYDHIYSFNFNMFTVEYHLAKNKELRETIKRAMLEQAFYMLSNGDLTIEAGVDLIRLRALNTARILSSGLSSNVEKILLNSGVLNTIFHTRRIFIPDYEGDNY